MTQQNSYPSWLWDLRSLGRLQRVCPSQQPSHRAFCVVCAARATSPTDSSGPITHSLARSSVSAIHVEGMTNGDQSHCETVENGNSISPCLEQASPPSPSHRTHISTHNTFRWTNGSLPPTSFLAVWPRTVPIQSSHGRGTCGRVHRLVS